jgi:HD superfamily phosphohydrolase
MNNYLIVETDRNLIRDLNSNAIVNKNKSEYDQFIKMSEQKYKEKKEFENLKNEVNLIKNDLTEIKSLLTLIVNK